VAGLILTAYLLLRRVPLRTSRADFLWLTLVALLMFVGGNGLLTFSEVSVASGMASVLTATAPLWMAVLEMLWPWGERLTGPGWLGLFIGLGGVIVLLAPKLQHPGVLLTDAGPLLALLSAASWSIGSFVLRYRKLGVSHLAVAAYQMVLGGGGLLLLGFCLGEGSQAAGVQFTPGSVYAFFHLLVFGSLIGFVAYNWLLGNVSAARAGTYAYVNPMVAILIGWLLDNETITIWILAGVATILAGVALVRAGEHPQTIKEKAQWKMREDECAVALGTGPDWKERTQR
jgi:drug/metabolite transporter (DMT)-like permease